MLTCTHFVLYVENIEVTRQFYVDVLGCELRRGLREDFLSISVGGFIINFYKIQDQSFGKHYSQGIAHIGLELLSRQLVDTYYEKLKTDYPILEKKLNDFTEGPYRFFVKDPDNYTVEIHTWEGCNY